jgi:hypothetical protein
MLHRREMTRCAKCGNRDRFSRRKNWDSLLSVEVSASKGAPPAEMRRLKVRCLDNGCKLSSHWVPMPAAKLCPICTRPLMRVGKFWVCPEDGQISGRTESEPAELPAAAIPLRIFMSYGHDASEELVLRIKKDLEQRGHDVWFDKSGVKERGIAPGDDWRRAITDAIVQSNRVMSFLSKHSTRDPGVCLDEIAIAIGVKGGNIQTILLESETEVKPPPSISHIQWLDMQDWTARRGSGAWEEWYQSKFAEIVRVVESEESRRFAGEIEALNHHLKPISSDSRVAALLRKGFIGRTWLIDPIERWRIATDRTSRLFWITGDPGVGKSAFAAHLAHFGRDKVIAAQFVEWDKPDHRDARRVVRSLAFQLATRLPDYRKLLLTLPEIAELDRKNDPAELFTCLITNPLGLAIQGGRERYLIVIDALDEAGEGERNPLVEMLANNAPLLPDWIGLVVTSRPESAVKSPLRGLDPFVIDTQTEANRADLRAYLHHELGARLAAVEDPDGVVEQILKKSEGVFLYVEGVCRDVAEDRLSLDRLGQFPEGLGGTYFQYFRRQFPDTEHFRRSFRPALGAILAARTPLPVRILQQLFGWRDEELRDFNRALGSLFPVITERGEEIVKPYHKSIQDWLSDESRSGIFFVSASEGDRLLADHCWRQYLKDVDVMGHYEVNFAVLHLDAAGRAADAVRLRDDMGFRKRQLEIRIEESVANRRFRESVYNRRFTHDSTEAEWRNELQVLLNQMAPQKRWHPLPAFFRYHLGAQGDYTDIYVFGCCGKSVEVAFDKGEGLDAPSQYRADGCAEQ